MQSVDAIGGGVHGVARLTQGAREIVARHVVVFYDEDVHEQGILLRTVFLVALITLLTAAARADEEPKWTVGAGLGVAGFEDYRGADAVHVYPIPFPYLIYHGDFLKSDRKGVRGLLFAGDRLEINLSGNATAPGHNDPARFGMPNLKPTVELGPALDLHLWKRADSPWRLDLEVPVRAAYTVESSPRFIGGTLSPSLNLNARSPGRLVGWDFGLEAAALFADSRYDDYFYSVQPRFATGLRPAYSAPGGFGGTETSFTFAKRFPRYWIGGYLRHDSLGNAAFDPSPLVQTNHYWSMGIGFAWILRESKERVEVEN